MEWEPRGVVGIWSGDFRWSQPAGSGTAGLTELVPHRWLILAIDIGCGCQDRLLGGEVRVMGYDEVVHFRSEVSALEGYSPQHVSEAE